MAVRVQCPHVRKEVENVQTRRCGRGYSSGRQGHVPVQVSGRSGAAARLGSEMEGPGYLTPMPLLSRLSSTFLSPFS
jgi:hypothetical protein